MAAKHPFLALITITIVWSASQALATPSVHLSINSTQNGESVQPGDTIDWTIMFYASTGDNLGLAYLTVDLKQNELNPEKIVIPYGVMPAAMQDFADPNGVCNPGNGGYGGAQVGTDCYADLISIGGGQNTLGVAGSTMGTDTTVDSGVGQSGPAVFATGTFDAPDTTGIYVFQIENAVANVLDTVASAPNPSTVSEGRITWGLNATSFVFVVCPGDVDGDGDVDTSDISAVLSSYNKCYGDPGYLADADLTGDDCVNLADLTIVLGANGTVCDE